MSSGGLVTFDESLQVFAKAINDTFGSGILDSGVFLRDISGRLTFVVNDDQWEDRFVAAGSALANLLGPYVDDADFAISSPGRLFDASLNAREGAAKTQVHFDDAERHIWLIDRRAVGQDWLRQPAKGVSAIPIIVFASIKGGVGRTTALCVLAASLASKGKRVLALDMDLEAPGLGTMLLNDATTPKFGLLDYLVERGLRDLPDSFLIDLVGPSWLGGGRGRIDVVPAVGAIANSFPENVLSKISRAYIGSAPGLVGDGVADALVELVERLTSDGRYDVVLVDARAGLHETTAAAILGLGGEVYLFGVNQPQTVQGMNFLISHISARTEPQDDFWNRLTFVQAKSPSTMVSQDFSERISCILKAAMPSSSEVAPDMDDLAQSFDVEWSQEFQGSVEISEEIEGGSVSFLCIPEYEMYRDFDPVARPELLQHSIYEVVYSDFLRDALAVVDPDIEVFDGGGYVS